MQAMYKGLGCACATRDRVMFLHQVTRGMLAAILGLLCLTPAFSQEVPRVNWNLDDDHRHVVVTFQTTPPTSLKMDIGEVEGVIAGLGALRADMWPQVSKAYKLGQGIIDDPVVDPNWATEPAMINRGFHTILHIRDTRFGWLHYALPRDEARNLATLIQHQLDLPRPPATDTTPK
jgi:hypothetical protein